MDDQLLKLEISKKDIGGRIRELRKERGLTQQNLADAIGVTLNYISKIEPGKRLPSLEIIIYIAKILDVSIDYLIHGI